VTNLERAKRSAKRLQAKTEHARVTRDGNYPILLSRLAGAQVEVLGHIVRSINREKLPPPSWF